MRNSFTAASAASVSAVLLSGMLAGPANAALITLDWQTGDGMLVRDTETSLEWLNLSVTANQSYNYVADQLNGGNLSGFRFATNAEVVALFDQYFGIDLGPGFYGERPALVDSGVRAASEWLGDGISLGSDIYAPDANYRLVGFTGEVRQLDAHDDHGSRYVLGARSRWSDTDYFTTKDPVSFWELAVWDPHAVVLDDDFAHEWIGSYLVRNTVETPLPAAIWLLGTGLMGLGAIARRSRAGR